MHTRSDAERIVSVRPAGRLVTTGPVYNALRDAEGRHPAVLDFEDYAAREVSVRVSVADDESAVAVVDELLIASGVPRSQFTLALQD